MNEIRTSMTFYKLTIITLISILYCATSFAQTPEILPSINVTPNEIGRSIQYSGQSIIDKSSTLTPEDVSSSITLDYRTEKQFWLNDTDGSVWSKLVLSNNTDADFTTYLEYPFYQPTKVIFYYRLLNSSSPFQKIENDLMDSRYDRSIAFPRLTVPLPLKSQQSYEVIIESFSDVATPRFTEFRLWSINNLIIASNFEHIIFGVIFSFILLSATGCFILFKLLKEDFFLWYSLFALSSLPVLGFTSGILNLYIPNLDYHPLGTISMVILMATAVHFIRAYCHVSFYSIKADKILHFYATLILIALPIAIIGLHEIAMKIQLYTLFAFPITILMALFCGYRGEKQIKTLLLSFVIFYLILLNTNLQVLGFIEPTHDLVFLPTIGMIVQLSFVLWAMYSKAKVHHYDGTRKDLNLITDAYKEAFALQEKVKTQNELLKQAKEHAEFEARTDMLTHLPNRRAFMSLATMAMSQSIREKNPLCFLGFDIDNFKHINDEYGHPAGDAMLKRVGDVIRDVIRSSDFCGRIGGEEFMIGCHSNNAKDADFLGERLRKAIEDSVVIYNGRSFSATVSIGIAELAQGDNLDSLMKKADDAMYYSKTHGKNQVTHYKVA